jgi:hypothetical protein
MSFPIVAYYFIEPGPELATWLSSRVEPDFAGLLLEPQLFENDEFVGKTSWNPPEHLIRVKLLFLASLLDYTDLQSESGRENILGTAVISESIFDRWWRIRRIENQGNVKEFAPFLKSGITSVSKTGNPVVDEWLEQLRSDAG